MIESEAKKLGSYSKVYLGGYSEGCSMVLAAYLSIDEGPLGGVFGCSGSHCASVDWT